MIATQSLFDTKNSLSVSSDKTLEAINNQPLNQYDKSVSPRTPYTLSEYLFQRYKKLNKIHNEMLMILHVSSNLSFVNKKDYKSSESLYLKPLIELHNKIHDIYDETKCKGWDGYGAEPIEYLEEALQFATDLFSESRTLIESVDIFPENDGCFCFEWFKSNNRYINISVKNDKLIYTYKFGKNEGCGEKTPEGKQKLIEQIKEVG